MQGDVDPCRLTDAAIALDIRLRNGSLIDIDTRVLLQFQQDRDGAVGIP